LNLAELIALNARSRPSHPALVDAAETIDYRQLLHQVEQLAGQLLQAGVRAGDRVGLALPDDSTHLLLHWALARVGAVILPLDHRWTGAERDRAAAAFGARRVLHEHAETADDGLHLHVAELGAMRAAPLPPMPEDPELALLISLSSGTTGRPKGAIVTHRQMYERFVNQWVSLGFDCTDRFMAATPLYFGAGRSFGMSFLAAGATVLMYPPPYAPEALADAVNEHAATAIFLVPTMMRRLLALERPAPLLPGLRRLLASGERLHPEEAMRIRALLNPNLLAYYASSEGGGICTLQAGELATHADTVGRPGFRIEVEVIDAAGRPLPAGEIGRLRYRGPGCARAFLDADGSRREGDPGGWFHPGDLARIDAEGYVTLCGRESEVVIRGGVNIHPAEIEAALAEHPAVAEAAVIGVPSATHGEELLAVVRAGTTVSAAELQAHCAATLAPYKVPARFELVAELPRAASGKIDKQALRRRCSLD